MIGNEALRQALVEAGVDPGDGDDPASDGTAPDGTAAAAQPQVVADRERYEALLADAGLVDVDAAREEYEATASFGGLTCLRLLIVDDVEAGDDAMAELDDGADFVEVASDLDDAFAQTGGSLSGNPEELCFDPATLTDAAAPILEAAAEAGAGTPFGPVETDVATVVAIAPPFDEVSGELSAGLAGAVVARIVAGADVTVAPRYGTWDPVSGTVVRLGQPVDTVADVSVETAP
jgi:hypothetical protein